MTVRDDEFADRVAVLLGGGSGLGFAVAERVVAGGGSVILGGRRPERLERAAAALGPSTRWAAVDTSDPD